MTTNPLSDQKVNQIHEELVRKQEDKKDSGMLEKIPYESRKWIALAVIGILYYISKNEIDIGKGILILGGAFFVMLIFIQGNDNKSGRLTEQDCVISLYKKLVWKQQFRLGKHCQLPKGEIIIDLVGKERWTDGKPWKREIGFYIKLYTTKQNKHYSAEIDITSGDIIGIRERLKRYTGAESPDIRYIASLDLQKEKMYHEFGGKNYAGSRKN